MLGLPRRAALLRVRVPMRVRVPVPVPVRSAVCRVMLFIRLDRMILMCLRAQRAVHFETVSVNHFPYRLSPRWCDGPARAPVGAEPVHRTTEPLREEAPVRLLHLVC